MHTSYFTNEVTEPQHCHMRRKVSRPKTGVHTGALLKVLHRGYGGISVGGIFDPKETRGSMDQAEICQHSSAHVPELFNLL